MSIAVPTDKLHKYMFWLSLLALVTVTFSALF